MSYCRWSSDNWRCDLYCYEDANGGWTTHVAGNRVVGEIPREPDWDLLKPSSSEADKKRWMAEHQAVNEFLETAEYRPLALPHAGKTFNDPTLEAFKERLLWLRGLGYSFPDYVLDEIDEEIATAPDLSAQEPF